jgi:DeoR/GlpR family transcriptional regulator of sugar metabolism
MADENQSASVADKAIEAAQTALPAEEHKEEEVAEVTVEGLKNGTAKYELASRLLTLITDRKSWFLYIGTFAFFYFNIKGKPEVFSATHLLATFGIVGGVSVAKDIIEKVKK